jgi:hypothetical protein
MKNLLFVWMLFSVLILARESRAGETRAIELKDGSMVTGEVVSLTNGKYTIRSGNLGTIEIEESKVRTIRTVAAAPASTTTGAAPVSTTGAAPVSTTGAAPASTTGAAPASTTGDIKTLTDRMMNDKDIMEKIQSLQNDPDFLKLLEDPGVMKAVNSGDIATLMANPRFMKLMNNPTVHEIEQKVK